MKKLFKSCGVLFAFLMMLSVSTTVANAQSCSTAIDKICKAFTYMNETVQSLNSFEEFDNIDFNPAVERSGVNDIPDSCASYVLTSSDKTKLKKAFNLYVDGLSTKLYKLSAGMLSKSDIDEMLSPTKTNYNKCVDNARTLMDALEGMQAIF